MAAYAETKKKKKSREQKLTNVKQWNIIIITQYINVQNQDLPVQLFSNT